MRNSIILFIISLLICFKAISQSVPGYNTPGDSIVYMEYFIDQDPGFGNGTGLAISADDTIIIDVDIDVSSLLSGLHTLHVRAQDDTGLWSLMQTNSFYVKPQAFFGNQNPPGADINLVEYFIDEDPGIGNATAISDVATAQIQLDSIINVSSLAVGMHTLHVRSRDADGLWSLMQSNAFYVKPYMFFGNQNSPGADIDLVEYFIGEDPGFRNGIAVSSIDSAHIQIDSLINVFGIPPGLHVLHVRSRDNDGLWSLMQSNTFYVDQEVFFQQRPTPIGNILKAEYFVDIDPGFGLGIAIPGMDSVAFNFSGEICVNSIDSGLHYIHARAQDEDRYWSLMQVDTFEVNRVKTPKIIVDNKTVFLDSIGEFTFQNLSMLIDSMIDLCSFDSVWLNKSSFNCSDVGDTSMVVLAAVDIHDVQVGDTFYITTMDTFNVCCPDVLAVNDAIIADEIYGAAISISSTGKVPDAGDVTFKAGQYIDLFASFEVELGGVFHSIIEDPCGN